MSQEREEPVFDAGEIDIDRFDVARPGRRGVEVFHAKICKDAAFKLQLDLQVLFRRIVKSDLSTRI